MTAKPATVKKLEALNDVYKAKKSEYDASVSSYQASLASLAELLKYVEALEDAGSSDAPAYRAEYENKKRNSDVFGQQLSRREKNFAEMKAGIDGGYAELDAAEKDLFPQKQSPWIIRRQNLQPQKRVLKRRCGHGFRPRRV